MAAVAGRSAVAAGEVIGAAGKKTGRRQSTNAAGARTIAPAVHFPSALSQHAGVV